MFEKLIPLPLAVTEAERYSEQQLMFMIDKAIEPIPIDKDEYIILQSQCKSYDSDILLHDNGDLYVLLFAKEKEKYFVAKLLEQFYKGIMVKSIKH